MEEYVVFLKHFNNISITFRVSIDQENSFPDTLHYSVAIFISVLAVFSIIGNVLTIIILKSQKKCSQQIKYYRIQLASTHVISVVASYWILIVNSIRGKWIFGHIGCTFYGFLQASCAFFSILVVAAIAFNRASSLKAVAPAPLQETIRNSVILWIITFALSAPPLFGLNRYITEGFGTMCCIDLHPIDTFARIYIFYILLLGFIIPLAIIFFSYRRVVVVLFKSAIFRQKSKNHFAVVQSETDPSNQAAIMLQSNSALPQLSSDLGLFTKLMIIWRDQRNFQSLIRPLRTMSMVTVCFVCVWLPYAILATLGQFVSFGSIGPYLVAITGLIAKSYVAFDPVIYVMTDATFRRRMLGILHRVDIGASRTTRHDV